MNDDANPCPGKSCQPQLTPGDCLATMRILDANFNRATEGLRVVEEYCRFVLADRCLTEHCKQLRHELVAALAGITRESLHAAREAQDDVGAQVTTSQEASRESLCHVAEANWKRVEQALRAIEEYGKLLTGNIGSRVEQLRYRTYTLSKACRITAESQKRLLGARLYVLTDGCDSERVFVERVQDLIAGGVHVIQLRDKKLDDRTLLARARLLHRMIDELQLAEWGSERAGEAEIVESPRLSISASPPRPLFILNDRPDIAVLARADGVHVGQEELTVHEVRRIVGPEMLVGVSTHNLDQARQAVLDGANYLGCGPTFPSGTKAFTGFPGLAFLQQVAAEISLPAFAIGGITLENLPQVLDTGFTRVAVGGAIATSANPRAESRKFLTLLRHRA